MCRRINLAEKTAWRIPVVSGVFAFVLGISCFGVAMKLSQYENSPNLPPMLAGIPVSTHLRTKLPLVRSYDRSDINNFRSAYPGKHAMNSL